MSTINNTSSEVAFEQAWLTAEAHIRRRIGSLTIWEAERWAAAHERQLNRVSLLELQVAYLDASGRSAEGDYLQSAFSRIEAEIAQLDWAPDAETSTDADRVVALNETASAVAAVARHALSAVVLADGAEFPF